MLEPLKTVIVMGVCGCGKSRVGKMLARRLGGAFEDADDFHPAANKAKMSSGVPLTDEDRRPWYAILRTLVEDARRRPGILVLACSALKPVYREWLRNGDGPGEMVFVLLEGRRETIWKRLSARKGHFMPPSLLDSQLATLEVTPDVWPVSLEQTPKAMVNEILRRLDEETVCRA